LGGTLGGLGATGVSPVGSESGFSSVEELIMTWQDHITVDQNVLVGKPIVKGTRISVEFVIDLLARGWTAVDVLKEYDHLKPDDIQACLAYASDLLKSEKIYLLPTS
jgi:uncharacterized protein (DUF433 family)